MPLNISEHYINDLGSNIQVTKKTMDLKIPIHYVLQRITKKNYLHVKSYHNSHEKRWKWKVNQQ